MNVVVTGASSGIGYEIVKELVRAKVSTIYTISRNRNQLDALKEECKSIGNTEVIVLPIDLCEINTMDLNSVINNETIDIIINNAGYLVNKPFENISLQQLEQVYQTNVFGPFLLIQQLLSNLKKSKIAHIVNIGSMGGVQGASKFPGLSAYSSSKAAIASLSECLAEELKKDNIKVNCLALGAVNTEMLSSAFPGYTAQMQPKDMAKYIVRFAMKDYQFINGKIIPISFSTP